MGNPLHWDYDLRATFIIPPYINKPSSIFGCRKDMTPPGTISGSKRQNIGSLSHLSWARWNGHLRVYTLLISVKLNPQHVLRARPILTWSCYLIDWLKFTARPCTRLCAAHLAWYSNWGTDFMCLSVNGFAAIHKWPPWVTKVLLVTLPRDL